jgi:hypothetical protein
MGSMRLEMSRKRFLLRSIPPVEIAKELLPDFHRTEKPLGGNFNQTIFEFPPDCLKSLHVKDLL